MAKSKLRSQKDKPVLICPVTHKVIRRIAFQCEIAIERLVNALLERDLQDKEGLKKVLLELEIDPKCLDEMF